jgi:hypothetical protein
MRVRKSSNQGNNGEYLLTQFNRITFDTNIIPAAWTEAI